MLHNSNPDVELIQFGTKKLRKISLGDLVSNISVITNSSMVCCNIESVVNCSGPDIKIKVWSWFRPPLSICCTYIVWYASLLYA